MAKKLTDDKNLSKQIEALGAVLGGIADVLEKARADTKILQKNVKSGIALCYRPPKARKAAKKTTKKAK